MEKSKEGLVIINECKCSGTSEGGGGGWVIQCSVEGKGNKRVGLMLFDGFTHKGKGHKYRNTVKTDYQNSPP